MTIPFLSGRTRVARVMKRFTNVTAELAAAADQLQQEHTDLHDKLNEIQGEQRRVMKSMTLANNLRFSIEKMLEAPVL